MAKPNFFIVGAPKCATSAMSEYLKQHPDIFMSQEKEPHYFCTDISTPRGIVNKNDYLALFADGDNAKRRGEASVLYLYSENAASEIKAFAPEAKIIIMLRNPVDMMYSWHSERLYVGHETIEDFKTAVKAEEDRKKSLWNPPCDYSIKVFFYRDIATFSPQVKRYFDIFGKDNVHVIIFDDLKKDIAKVYRDTLEFLEVDPSFQPEFPVVNPNKKPRNKFIQQLINEPPQMVQIIGKKILPDYNQRRALISKLRRINRRHEARQPMTPDFRRQLLEEFTPEVGQLSSLLGRDLTHWCRS